MFVLLKKSSMTILHAHQAPRQYKTTVFSYISGFFRNFYLLFFVLFYGRAYPLHFIGFVCYNVCIQTVFVRLFISLKKAVNCYEDPA